ncbi:MAG: hypothetical protein NZM44_03780, partial [Candidatus Calescibacterium sp.]|nr:hypothetical protein [Candidatus Calescibacterium sp.]
TVISTRFNNTDNIGNRMFYTQSTNQPVDQRIGGWNLPGNGNFTPNNFTVNLGGPNGVNYVLPSQDSASYDRRRQVIRTLEGNVIIQDFNDQIGTGQIGRIDNGENGGYVGFNISQTPNSINPRRAGGKLSILSHNFVLLNYQFRQNQRPVFNGNNIRAGLAADIISYRGSLQIVDEDSFRFLLDTGRFRRTEAENFLNNITTNDRLYWYGKYIGNFANVEGIMLQNGNVRGFGETTIDSSDYNPNLPRSTRRDYRVLINNRPIILFDVIQFQINK